MPNFVGDNECDDENNYESCDWDGGDCCGDDVNTTYCSLCKCLDPNAISKQPQISNGTNSKLLSNTISSGIKDDLEYKVRNLKKILSFTYIKI